MPMYFDDNSEESESDTNLNSEQEMHKKTYNEFCSEFNIPKVIDRRRIKLESIGTFIPMFEGRPERNTSINNDDILNLKIGLNVSNDVTQFMRMI